MLTATSPIKAAEQSGPSLSGGSGTLDRDAFLRLLITQIQMQDPLEPMSAGEYVAQLATFSNLEQLQNANIQLAVLNHVQAVCQAFLLIGRTITTVDNGVSGTVTGITFQDGQPKLLVGDQVVDPGDVVGVS